MKSKLGNLIKKELVLSFGMRNPKKEPNPIRFFLIPLFLLAIGPTIWLYVMVLATSAVSAPPLRGRAATTMRI